MVINFPSEAALSLYGVYFWVSASVWLDKILVISQGRRGNLEFKVISQVSLVKLHTFSPLHKKGGIR